MELRPGTAGADVEIYSAPGASSAPEDLDGWTQVGQAAGVGAQQRIELTSQTASRFYLVWFTQLPEAEDGSGFQAEVSDINLIGA